ncbi:MBL fold metallo-hydrolase [[Muricauda] lutisoli]|uniref:MBL fold metallo-hydrolase n=1 Tax=[Muricauda] lutisoli TaxID=2816035 RepID=A0ABS3EZZ9_9FLAO|nr:MBL fold metallo-hydrolase [[Muricauda] lutisoli]MBO0331844.1 MBL fold metallo-hydrolase [[Muricauda] lutisoli]
MKKLLFIISIFLLIIQNSMARDIQSGFVVTAIAKNVYSIVSPSIGLPTPENKGWNSNVHFVVTRTGVLLFDTGSSETIGNHIKKAIKTVTDLPVRWVINSHSHADHWLGNAAFADTVVEIIASEQAVATMRKYGQDDVEFYAKVTNGTIGTTQLKYPDLLLNQGQKRNFGGVDVEFIFSNGAHSPGDILIWLPEQKIIFGGDVVSSDWMPMITDHGNVPNLIDTLHKIAKLSPSIVLAGHGKATSVKAIIRDAELLSTVWERISTDHKNGMKSNKTLLLVKADLAPKYKALYQDFETEIERYVKLMYRLQQ